MASGRPWYKRSGGDFVLGTLHMPMEERLAYCLIIDMLNDRDEPLPDDAEFICGFTKFSKRLWSRVRQFLLTDKDSNGETRLFIDDTGRLSNPRFARELAERQKEHERSVRAGREGGKKSAELRAKNQGELELKSSFSQFSTPENELKSQKLLPEKTQKPQKSATSIQPPPQPIARAKEAKSIEYKQSNTGDSPARTRAREAPIDRSFEVVLDQVLGAAGCQLISENHRAAQITILSSWLDRGVSLEAVILPVIRSTVARTSDPTSSLKRFNRSVLLEHAKHTAPARRGKPYKPPPEPITQLPGEDDRIIAFRKELAKRTGIDVYSRVFTAQVRFAMIEERNAIRIDADNAARINDGEMAHHLTHAARAAGFDQVW